MTKPHRTPHAGRALDRLLARIDALPTWLVWLLAIAQVVAALVAVRLYFGPLPS